MSAVQYDLDNVRVSLPAGLLTAAGGAAPSELALVFLIGGAIYQLKGDNVDTPYDDDNGTDYEFALSENIAVGQFHAVNVTAKIAGGAAQELLDIRLKRAGAPDLSSVTLASHITGKEGGMTITLPTDLDAINGHSTMTSAVLALLVDDQAQSVIKTFEAADLVGVNDTVDLDIGFNGSDLVGSDHSDSLSLVMKIENAIGQSSSKTISGIPLTDLPEPIDIADVSVFSQGSNSMLIKYKGFNKTFYTGASVVKSVIKVFKAINTTTTDPITGIDSTVTTYEKIGNDIDFLMNGDYAIADDDVRQLIDYEHSIADISTSLGVSLPATVPVEVLISRVIADANDDLISDTAVPGANSSTFTPKYLDANQDAVKNVGGYITVADPTVASPNTRAVSLNTKEVRELLEYAQDNGMPVKQVIFELIGSGSALVVAGSLLINDVRALEGGLTQVGNIKYLIQNLLEKEDVLENDPETGLPWAEGHDNEGAMITQNKMSVNGHPHIVFDLVTTEVVNGDVTSYTYTLTHPLIKYLSEAELLAYDGLARTLSQTNTQIVGALIPIATFNAADVSLAAELAVDSLPSQSDVEGWWNFKIDTDPDINNGEADRFIGHRVYTMYSDGDILNPQPKPVFGSVGGATYMGVFNLNAAGDSLLSLPGGSQKVRFEVRHGNQAASNFKLYAYERTATTVVDPDTGVSTTTYSWGNPIEMAETTGGYVVEDVAANTLASAIIDVTGKLDFKKSYAFASKAELALNENITESGITVGGDYLAGHGKLAAGTTDPAGATNDNIGLFRLFESATAGSGISTIIGTQGEGGKYQISASFNPSAQRMTFNDRNGALLRLRARTTLLDAGKYAEMLLDSELAADHADIEVIDHFVDAVEGDSLGVDAVSGKHIVQFTPVLKPALGFAAKVEFFITLNADHAQYASNAHKFLGVDALDNSTIFQIPITSSQIVSTSSNVVSPPSASVAAISSNTQTWVVNINGVKHNGNGLVSIVVIGYGEDKSVSEVNNSLARVVTFAVDSMTKEQMRVPNDDPNAVGYDAEAVGAAQELALANLKDPSFEGNHAIRLPTTQFDRLNENHDYDGVFVVLSNGSHQFVIGSSTDENTPLTLP